MGNINLNSGILNMEIGKHQQLFPHPTMTNLSNNDKLSPYSAMTKFSYINDKLLFVHNDKLSPPSVTQQQQSVSVNMVRARLEPATHLDVHSGQ